MMKAAAKKKLNLPANRVNDFASLKRYIDDLHTTLRECFLGDFYVESDLNVTRDINIFEGTLVLHDTVWEDLRFPATAIYPPGVSDPDFDATHIGWLFDAGGTEVLFFIAQIPHQWKVDSNLKAHVHWMPTNTNTGKVLWRLEYKWTNIDEVDAGSWTTLNVLDSGAGTAYTHQIAAFASIDGTGKEISSILTIKLSRIGGDATDTYNTDALLKEFDIHYEIDTLGSREEYSK